MSTRYKVVCWPERERWYFWILDTQKETLIINVFRVVKEFKTMNAAEIYCKEMNYQEGGI